MEDAAARLKIDQLAVRTGMTVRNIRAHVTRGLLPAPHMQGRTAYYGPEHVARLELIAALQQQGFNLASIRRLVAGPTAPSPEETVAFYRTVLGPWLTEAPEIHEERELAAQFGLVPDPELIAKLQSFGLLEPLGEGRVRVLNPTILRVGQELARLGFATEQLIGVLEVLLAHSSAVSEAFVAMFLQTHWTAYVDAGMPPDRLPELPRVIQALHALARVIRALPRLASQAVGAASQQEMAQATSRAFAREPASHDTGASRTQA